MIKINRNTELANEAKKQLKEHNGYCPCALEQNIDTKCICKDFRDKVSNGYIGECHCGLYENI